MITLTAVKSADKNYVFMGSSNKIRYSIVINNTGDEIATCVKVKDVLSRGVCCLSKTLMVDGCCVEWSWCNGELFIECIEPGGNVVISFEAEVSKNYSLPTIKNKAIVTWPDRYGNISSIESNEVITPVININVCLKKSVDKMIAKVGEVIDYSVLIRNNSNIEIKNVRFYDVLSPGLELLPSSVIVGGETQFIDSFDGGLYIGNMKAYSGNIISFQAKVKYMPNNGFITNKSNIEYEYTVYDNNILVQSIGESISNCAVTKILELRCGC